MSEIIFELQKLCWNPFTLSAFIGTGLYFTVKSGFFQLRHPFLIFSNTFGSLGKKTGNDGISPFSALSCALAACMGTGNIIGVAAAITAGGPGAVFWMILSALLGEMTCCAENILGIENRAKNEKNEWLGGSMLYIEKAFSSRKAACIFSFFCIGASLGMGNMTQANAISSALCESRDFSPVATGIAVASLTGMILLGGLKRISSFTEKIIPVASAVFILALIAVIIKNSSGIPHALCEIFKGAFGIKAVGGGIAGSTVAKAVKAGVARGVFSNEAGLGSSPIVHAAADVPNSITQGMWGIAEVFIDTVLMCTLTALALLSSKAYNPEISPTQMNIAAFQTVLGDNSQHFVCVSLCVFAFATVTGWAYYGEKAAEYAFGPKAVTPYRIIYLIFIVIGCTSKLETVWAAADIFNALMAVPNLIAIIKLRKEAVTQIKKFTGRIKPCR